jgi:hypothetical protein
MSEDLFSLARNENKSFSPSTASSLARTASPSDATRVFIHFLSLALARAAVLATTVRVELGSSGHLVVETCI